MSLGSPGYGVEEAIAWIEKTAAEGTQVFDWACRRKDGSAFWAEVALRTAELADQPVVIAAVRDITERRGTMKALAESEHRLRTLTEHLPNIGLYQLRVLPDETRQFVFISPGMARLHDVDPEAVYADPSVIYGRIHKDDAPRVHEAELRSIESSEPFFFETRFVEPGGVRHALLRSAPRPQPDGSVLWEGAEIDITAQRAAEAEQSRLEEGLRHAQKMESVGRLAGGIAHDFNNLLTAIFGNLSLAQNDLGPEHPTAVLLGEALQAAELAARLTRQLLAFSRKEVVAPRPLDLGELVRTTEDILRRLIGEDVVLHTQLEPELGTVLMDPGHAEQVLMNLVVNAREAMPRGGTLMVSTSNVELDDVRAGELGLPPGPYVCLSVADEGHGMSDEVKSRLFEPFFTTRERGAGTGLGLATVYGAVRRGSGAIQVASETGQGAVFAVYLPRVETAPQPTEEPIAPVTGGQETILVVEDDDSVRSIAVRVLKRNGYRVRAYGDPTAASKDTEPADLLLTDVVMPALGGRELADVLRRSRPELVVLFTSGYTDDVVLRHGVEEQRVDFLAKPYAPKTLLERVREALERRPREP